MSRQYNSIECCNYKDLKYLKDGCFSSSVIFIRPLPKRKKIDCRIKKDISVNSDNNFKELGDLVHVFNFAESVFYLPNRGNVIYCTVLLRRLHCDIVCHREDD